MQHNLVNKKLGKAEFDCSIKSIDERWREGHSSCFQQTTSSKESLGRDA